MRAQLVLPSAVISDGREVAGGDALEALPESIVMTTEDCVDAALAGLDQGDTAPSLHDISLLEEYLGLSGRMLESVFDARPAGRYGVGGGGEGASIVTGLICPAPCLRRGMKLNPKHSRLNRNDRH